MKIFLSISQQNSQSLRLSTGHNSRGSCTYGSNKVNHGYHQTVVLLNKLLHFSSGLLARIHGFILQCLLRFSLVSSHRQQSMHVQ